MSTNKQKIETLHSLSKFKKRKIDDMKYGVWLAVLHGRPIQELTDQIVRDRINLARYCMKTANYSFLVGKQYRLATARSYYAFYHAARAVTYYSFGGDDHEDHSALHKNLPPDMADRDDWANALSASRLLRNEADYEPYPAGDAPFKTKASKSLQDAKDFLAHVVSYLRGKGCPI
jgi:uncharacterized protein (UPF0332 family)